jgi:hypothetical protein
LEGVIERLHGGVLLFDGDLVVHLRAHVHTVTPQGRNEGRRLVRNSVVFCGRSEGRSTQNPLRIGPFFAPGASSFGPMRRIWRIARRGSVGGRLLVGVASEPSLGSAGEYWAKALLIACC